MPSIVPLLFLYLSSIYPLVLGVLFPPTDGAVQALGLNPNPTAAAGLSGFDRAVT